MTEGYFNQDYWILFEEPTEALEMSKLYGIGAFLPGYTLSGLKSWDDFVIRNSEGKLFTVPTVPAISQYVESLQLEINSSALVGDSRARPARRKT